MLETILTGAKKVARNTMIAVTMAVSLYACKGNPGPGPTPVPKNQNIALKVYNATEGYKGDVVKLSNGDRLNISVQEITSQLNVGSVYPEITIRYMPSSSNQNGLGNLKFATGSEASFLVDDTQYELYLPSAANSAEYNCHPNPTLRNGRNAIIGELHEGSATGPMEVWTDKITNFNDNLVSGDGRKRYGSAVFQGNAANPNFTVGFSNINRGGFAYVINSKNAYMLGREYRDFTLPNGMNYQLNGIKDGALEEIFEGLTFPASADDLCGDSSKLKIGLAYITNNAQSGLSPAGIDFVRRAYTRAQ